MTRNQAKDSLGLNSEHPLGPRKLVTLQYQKEAAHCQTILYARVGDNSRDMLTSNRFPDY